MLLKLQLTSIYWAYVMATSLDVIDTVMEDIVTNLKKFIAWCEVRHITSRELNTIWLKLDF